jgi:exopolysaccharide biosynthesis polyprenyl glycosylphosphotransferase
MLDDDVARIDPSTNVVGLPRQREVPAAAPTTAPRGVLQEGLHPLPGKVRRRRTVVWVAAVDAAAFAGAVVLVPPRGVHSGAVLLISLLLLNAVAEHYRDPVSPALLDQLPSIAMNVFVAVGLAFVFGELYREAIPLLFVVLLAGFILIARGLAYAVVRHWRRSHKAGRPTIIAGLGPVGRRVATVLLDHPEYGRRPVGFVDEHTPAPEETPPVPLLGSTGELPRLLADAPACDAIVADAGIDETGLARTLRACDRVAGEIFLVPRLPEVHAAHDQLAMLGCPLTRLRRSAHRSLTWRIKRFVDVSVAAMCLVALLPVIGTLAVLVYLEGGPHVIFKQERVGLDHRRFMIWKFRSLAPSDGLESDTRWSIVGDERLGPVGRMLRTLSLDELPQLVNVIRGDMSLVGPRPERPFFVEQFSRLYPHYDDRHRAPAGLTGWAQISGLRGDTDIAERARMDNQYIASWSLWTDIKTMLRTAGSFVSRSR